MVPEIAKAFAIITYITLRFLWLPEFLTGTRSSWWPMLEKVTRNILTVCINFSYNWRKAPSFLWTQFFTQHPSAGLILCTKLPMGHNWRANTYSTVYLPKLSLFLPLLKARLCSGLTSLDWMSLRKQEEPSYASSSGLLNIFIGNIMANYYQLSLQETKITTCTALASKPAKSYRLSCSFAKKKKKSPKPQIFFSSKCRYPDTKSVRTQSWKFRKMPWISILQLNHMAIPWFSSLDNL